MTDPDGSPRATALRELPDDILAVALRNDRKRFFIPSGENSFAGIHYEYVMIDSGCNSVLLPFPDDFNSLLQFNSNQYFWEVAWSGGTGLISTPTLLIYCPETGEEIGDLSLAGRFVVRLKSLRFHLGTDSARSLLGANLLDETNASKLQGFLDDLGERHSPERRYVLLGQAVLSKVFSLQAGCMFLLAKRGYFPTREDFRAAWLVIRRFQDLGLTPTEFHDLDDVDHDGDILGAWSDEIDDENWQLTAFMD